MTTLIFTNPTHQHAELFYRVSRDTSSRVYTVHVPFRGGITNVNLSELNLDPVEEQPRIISQLDVQARALGLSYKEK